MNHPLGWLADFEVNCDKAPVEKIHTPNEIAKAHGNTTTDKIILIIRNPKEALSRHGGTEITLPVLLGKEAKGNSDPRIYFNDIALYDTWNAQNRLLIYYEDLVRKPIETFIMVLLFLEEPFGRIDCFMQEYAAHKKKALSIYKASESEGNDLLYHSKLIDPQHRKQIDRWIEELYPTMWQTYLKIRYAEENLVYE
jgi:hypothetical protein